MAGVFFTGALLCEASVRIGRSGASSSVLIFDMACTLINLAFGAALILFSFENRRRRRTQERRSKWTAGGDPVGISLTYPSTA